MRMSDSIKAMSASREKKLKIKLWGSHLEVSGVRKKQQMDKE
jgi:hypothetical protein